MAPQMKLYTLNSTPDDIAAGKPGFSPYVWRTILALNYLGVDYATCGLTFAQIRGEFSERMKNKEITVPTIEMDDGNVITDSWKIAEYLEEKYAKPAGKTLFGPTAESKNFCQFMHAFGGAALAKEMSQLFMPMVYTSLDGPSADYVFNVKVYKGDASARDKAVSAATTPESIQSIIANSKARLAVIEMYLSAVRKQSPDQKRFFLQGGEEPTFADFIVYGWYCISKLHKDIDQAWRAESLPNVSKWLDDVVASGVVKQQDVDNIAAKSAKSYL